MDAPGLKSDAGVALGFLADLVGYRIRLVQIAAFKDFEESAKGFGLAPRYYGLLSLIATNPGLPQARLAEAIHLVRSSLVPILDKLQTAGLVERRASLTDRRTNGVWLTSKGAKVVDKLRPLILDHEDHLTAGFSADERDTLLRLLGRVDANLRIGVKTAEQVA